MDVPTGFWALTMRFYQDTLDFVEASETALADYLVRGLDQEERQGLAGFLDVVLAKPDAGNRLQRLWKKSRADFGFVRAKDIGDFFVIVRSRI